MRGIGFRKSSSRDLKITRVPNSGKDAVRSGTKQSFHRLPIDPGKIAKNDTPPIVWKRKSVPQELSSPSSSSSSHQVDYSKNLERWKGNLSRMENDLKNLENTFKGVGDDIKSMSIEERQSEINRLTDKLNSGQPVMPRIIRLGHANRLEREIKTKKESVHTAKEQVRRHETILQGSQITPLRPHRFEVPLPKLPEHSKIQDTAAKSLKTTKFPLPLPPRGERASSPALPEGSLPPLPKRSSEDTKGVDNSPPPPLRHHRFAVFELGTIQDPTPKQGAHRNAAVSRSFQRQVTNFPPSPPPASAKPIKAIDYNFTTNKTIDEQRIAHEASKDYLKNELGSMGADVSFVAPPALSPEQSMDNTFISEPLNSSVFSWESSNGVQGDIQRDGKNSSERVVYGVASQFNTCEASARFTPQPGTAVETYKTDHTQGPGAQLQFVNQQVETLNNAANQGFNGLCKVLDESTKTAMKHGYLTPQSYEEADAIIRQLKENGDKLEFPCVGNIPKGDGNTESVYQMLVAAPAFGVYDIPSNVTLEQKNEIQFLIALQNYRGQFQQSIALAKQDPSKPLVFKPTAPGLGVFGNQPGIVAKAFYAAAKEYENDLRDNGVQVRLQVFRGTGKAREMANFLRLQENR